MCLRVCVWGGVDLQVVVMYDNLPRSRNNVRAVRGAALCYLLLDDQRKAADAAAGAGGDGEESKVRCCCF